MAQMSVDDVIDLLADDLADLCREPVALETIVRGVECEMYTER